MRRGLRRVLVLAGMAGLAAGLAFIAWNAVGSGGGGSDARRVAEPSGSNGTGSATTDAPRATSRAPDSRLGDVRKLKREARQAKLSTRLFELSSPDVSGLPPDELAKRLGLPADGPGSLMERDQGRYLVDARVADVSPATLAALEAAGAHVLNADAEYLVATLEVAPAQLRAVARVPAVESVEEVLQPIVGGGTGPSVASQVGTLACTPTISEGDAQLRADQARSLGVDGTGIGVGILSDSYDTSVHALGSASTDIGTGDLPGTVNPCGHYTGVSVLFDPPGSPIPEDDTTDEGRALLQVVHDLAPGSPLSFASAYYSQTAFANRIKNLSALGAKVIADDVA